MSKSLKFIIRSLDSQIVAAAGNDAEDACNWSPGSALAVVTVGATNKTDDRAAFYSNFGPCVKIVG
jgi:subtilisin family serine protease